MEAWTNFAVVVGGAAAALLGLLFVAISIRLGAVAKSAELRNRAAQVLALFGAVLIAAILLTVPGQPMRLYGAELVVLAAVTGTLLFLLERSARQSPSEQHIGPVLTPVLLLASGVVLLLGLTAGLYVLIAAVLAAFVGGVATAWLFMIRLEE